MFGEEFHINRARGGVVSFSLVSLIEKEGGKEDHRRETEPGDDKVCTKPKSTVHEKTSVVQS